MIIILLLGIAIMIMRVAGHPKRRMRILEEEEGGG